MNIKNIYRLGKNSIIVLIGICILALIFCFVLSKKAYAKSEINLSSSKEQVNQEDDFAITVSANDTDIASYTIWLYFDNEQVEYVSGVDNLNIIDNRIIYTWFSETGKNVNFGELASFNFKAKKDGTASFSVIGEFYNQKGEKLDINSSQIEVTIGEDLETLNEENFSTDASDSSLEIMRLNQEGVNPSFDKNIKEYYLIVDENTQSLDVTAIATNRNAKVSVSGNENLEEGLNEIKISVTSEDGESTSDYIVNVTKTNNEEDADANLENLAIEYYTLTPEFDSDITNYSVEVSKDTNSLNILAIPEDFDAKVTVERKRILENRRKSDNNKCYCSKWNYNEKVLY